jgi:DUF4097 and DUF4098 domain-containing protein YvlB
LKGDTLTGSSVISSDAGDIYLDQGSVSGTTSLSTIDGSVTFEQEALSGKLSTFVGANANISFSGTLDPEGTYQFTTYKGNIDLTLPADTSMQVQTSIGVGGSYYTDFPASTGQSPQALLDLKTTSGGVHIHEQHA